MEAHRLQQMEAQVAGRWATIARVQSALAAELAATTQPDVMHRPVCVLPSDLKLNMTSSASSTQQLSFANWGQLLPPQSPLLPLPQQLDPWLDCLGLVE